MSSENRIASNSSPTESKTACSTEPLSLAMSEHSSVTGTPTAIREWLMLSRPAFPASRSALLGNDSQEMMSGTSGRKPQRLFATFDPDSFCWRTSQTCLLALMDTSDRYSESWPKVGTMLRGRCSVPLMLEHRISVGGFGSLAVGPHLAPYPTPSATAYGSSGNGNGNNTVSRGRPSLETMAAKAMWPRLPTPTATDWKGGTRLDQRRGQLTEARVMLWPTPKSSPSGPDFARVNRPRSGGDDLVTAVARFPTPTVGDSMGAGDRNRPGSKAHIGLSLTDRVVRELSTPAEKRVTRQRQLFESEGALTETVTLGEEESPKRTEKGKLNPDWVEWLMGWPLGWTRGGPVNQTAFLVWEYLFRTVSLG